MIRSLGNRSGSGQKTLWLVVGLLLLAAWGCSHSQPVQVLNAPPSLAFRTMGMVSGNGDNQASAMSMVVQQAENMEADAVIVQEQKTVGSQVIVTAKVIRYLAPPPAQ